MSEIEFKNGPELITILVGGIVVSILSILILDKVFGEWEYVLYAQILSSIFIMIFSYNSGKVIDTLVRINEDTGNIYAKNQSQFWEGHWSELTVFDIMQKEEVTPRRNETITIYKLYLELSDKSTYEINLKLDDLVTMKKIIIKLKGNK